MAPDTEQKDAIACAAAALSRAWGKQVLIDNVSALSDDERRNLILRATAHGDGAPPRSVIVKATRGKNYAPATDRAFESGLVKEWVALAFLTECTTGKGHSPVFLAGDAGRGLVVLEDLGAGLGSLVGPLLDGPADRARDALIAYAGSLGQMHADTLACIDGHAGILRRAFPAAPVTPPVGGAPWRREVADKVLSLLGGALPEDEIDTVAQRMANPGPWGGRAPREPSPDKVQQEGRRARMLDLELAGPGHVLLDASYWRMGFPTCWCAGRLPATVVAAMDRAYRQALAVALPAAQHDAFAQEMALLLFTRLFASLSWLLEGALNEDAKWGISTHRARLLWHLEAAIAGANDAATLPGLRDTAARWRADLCARWPDAQSLALYPAFSA